MADYEVMISVILTYYLAIILLSIGYKIQNETARDRRFYQLCKSAFSIFKIETDF